MLRPDPMTMTMSMSVPLSMSLQRFVDAQAPVYAQVLQELQRGRKQSHWMWFVFPQPRGLGRSATAQFYGLADAQEALAFARHPVLGERLRECTRALLQHRGQPLEDILGPVDSLKLCSCMSLFGRLLPGEGLFAQALQAFCGGREDPAVLDFCAAHAAPSAPPPHPPPHPPPPTTQQE